MKLGIYLDIKESNKRVYIQTGLLMLQDLYDHFDRAGLFRLSKITIWKGYPLLNAGEVITDSLRTIHAVRSDDLHEETTGTDRQGYRTNVIITHTVEVLGTFFVEEAGEILEIPGVMIFSGDETKDELPSIYIDSFSYGGKNLNDFLLGDRNPNKRKLILLLTQYHSNLAEHLSKKTSIFVGENPDCMQFLHQAKGIMVHDDLNFFKKFIQYAGDIQNRKIELEWLGVKKKEINEMLKRIYPLRKKFFHNMIDKIDIDAYGRKKAATRFFIDDWISGKVYVKRGSVQLFDKDFSGNTMKRMFNELIYRFSQVICDSLPPGKELEDKFITEFKKELKRWDMED